MATLAGAARSAGFVVSDGFVARGVLLGSSGAAFAPGAALFMGSEALVDFATGAAAVADGAVAGGAAFGVTVAARSDGGATGAAGAAGVAVDTDGGGAATAGMAGAEAVGGAVGGAGDAFAASGAALVADDATVGDEAAPDLGFTVSATHGTATTPMAPKTSTTRAIRNHGAEKIDRGSSSS